MTATEDKVPFELLDVDNYATWARRMKYLLVIKGLWSAVTNDNVDTDLNNKAMAVIGLRMKDHHLATLERCTTAKQAWQELACTFEAKSNARKRQLRKELSQLKMGVAEPLTKYIARAKEIQNQLRAAGYEVTDQEVAWALLAGLPAAYETIVTVLETSTDADLKLDDLLPKLMPMEQRMMAESPSRPQEAALMAKTGRQCWYCGKKGHLRDNCHKKKQDEARRGHGRTERTQFSSIAL